MDFAMFRENRVVALGFFDGIHIGHAALLRRLAEVSSQTGLKPAVMTFDTLPQNVLGGNGIKLINSIEDRAGLISRISGIDEIICIPFNKNLAETPWDDFFKDITETYCVKHFIIGDNFHFGKGALGNSRLLLDKCRENRLGCDVIGDVMYDGIVSSSTYIRGLLFEGNIQRANTFLGHPHVLTDSVRDGNRLGTRLGIPTINMRFDDAVLIPKHGVYATEVYPAGEGSSYMLPDAGMVGVTNIGVRPSVDDSKNVTVETHIPDFRQNLYGYKVRVEFHNFIRPEIKFPDIEELKKQIKKDCEDVKQYFESK